MKRKREIGQRKTLKRRRIEGLQEKLQKSYYNNCNARNGKKSVGKLGEMDIKQMEGKDKSKEHSLIY